MFPKRVILKRESNNRITCPRLDHIFIWLGPAPPTPPSLSGLLAHTCMGTLPHWEPMWQYLVKITHIEVDITFIIPKLIDGVPSHAKGARHYHIGSQWGRVPMQVRAGKPNSEGGVGGAGPNKWRCDLAWGGSLALIWGICLVTIMIYNFTITVTLWQFASKYAS